MNIDDYKVVVLDLDGTAVDYDSSFILDTLRAVLQEWKTLGKKVAVATGRPWFECQEIIDDIRPCWPVVCLDGRFVFDYERNQIKWMTPFSLNKIQSLIELLDENYYIYIEDSSCVYAQDKVSRLLFSSFFKVKRDKVSIGIPHDYVPLRIYLYSKKKKIDEHIEVKIKEILKSDIRYFKADDKWIVLSNSNINKLDAINRLADEFGISLDEIIAFGDGENDRLLLKKAGLGIAMGNSPANIKMVADWVTHSVQEDGVTYVLSNLLKRGGIVL